MHPRNRARIIKFGAFFSAMFVYGVLPPWDTWVRAAVTAVSCLAVCCLLSMVLPQPSKP